MVKSKSDKIIKKLLEEYSNAVPDLKFNNLFELTVSVLLSAQTTDKQVNKVTPSLFKKYNNFLKLSEAKKSDIEKLIKSTGFYKNKTKNLILMSKKIINDYNAELPNKREDLISLPGIGRKSANVILSVGYGIPALAVDTHIIRIANRLGYIDSPDPNKVESALTSKINERFWTKTHLALIKHGRAICKARNPLCGECFLLKLCENPVIRAH